jgi:hypothetical protein
MSQCTVTISMSGMRTRILVTDGTDELLRAVLPPPTQARDPRAAQTLLEGLALMLGHAVRVVVSAGDLDGTSFFGLTDEFGIRQNTVFYSVEVIERTRRRRSRRLAGVGDFRDLRQLSLVAGDRR